MIDSDAFIYLHHGGEDSNIPPNGWMILLMATRNPARKPVEVGSLSHYLQGGKIHSRWLGMGFLNHQLYHGTAMAISCTRLPWVGSPKKVTPKLSPPKRGSGKNGSCWVPICPNRRGCGERPERLSLMVTSLQAHVLVDFQENPFRQRLVGVGRDVSP